MIDRKLFQKTFSTLHASPDTLSEVYSVTAGGHYYTDLTAETAVTFDSTYTR